MNISLKGFDSKNNSIALPKILWYEQSIGRFGFEETFTIGFSKSVPFNLSKVFVTKENKKISECFVDSIEIDANKDGIFYRVKLKNVNCRLLENQVKPTVHKTFNIEKLLKKYALDLNIVCSMKSAHVIEIENFYVDLGMTPYDIIFLFFQTLYKKYIFLSEDNDLIFPFFPSTPLYFGNYKENNSAPINGIKYNTLKLVDDRSKIISDAYVKIDFEDDESEFLSLTEENVFAKDCNIKRVKYCSVPRQWLILPKNGSDFMVQKENKKRFSYEISTYENIDVYPGMIAKIKEIVENKDLVVVKVLKKVTDKGKLTTIYFKNYKL